MNRRKLIIPSFIAFLLGLLMSQNASFSQSKKKQIEALNLKIDSMNQVLTKERNAHKTSIGSLESQEFKSKLKVDSLTKSINTIEKQISTKQNDKLNYELEISRFKNRIENQRDSLLGLTKEENKIEINFKSVEIGNQIWMVENLSLSTFRNGDIIPEAKTAEEWEIAGSEGKPAWCYYNNDPENGKKYGKLYNGFAVNDPRGLAPEGWHIPSEEDWYDLQAQFSGKHLKSNRGWEKRTNGISGNGSNKSGFNALPTGFRYGDGKFGYLGSSTGFWESKSEYFKFHALHSEYRYPDGADGSDSLCDIIFGSETWGLSVRCVKD